MLEQARETGLLDTDPEEAFDRLAAVPTGGEKSTGLGLTIVKRLVEAHHGEVGVNSDGPGATFWVELPRAKR